MVTALAVGLAHASGCTRPPEAPGYKMIAAAADLMEGVLEPSIPRLLEIGGTVATARGIEQILPTDDEEWNVLRHKAMSIAEVGNLLLLEPRAKDADWANNARAMTEAALEVARSIDARNPKAVFDAGGRLYDACTGCHAKYLAP
jgi:hypothetical protein